jgi:hypothetical protein
MTPGENNMAWKSAVDTWVLVSREKYYEFRTDPEDEDNYQKRERLQAVYECQGLTAAAAKAAQTPAAYTNGTISYGLSRLAADGYTVTKTYNVSAADWSDGSGSGSEP